MRGSLTSYTPLPLRSALHGWPGIALIGVGVATAGLDDVVLIGGAAVTEVTVEASVAVAADATATAVGVDDLASAGSAARGGIDTYDCINGHRSWVTCGMTATGALLSAADPFLGLSPGRELLYNLFGLGWALATPECH